MPTVRVIALDAGGKASGLAAVDFDPLEATVRFVFMDFFRGEAVG